MYRLVTSIETRIAFLGTFLSDKLCGILEVRFLCFSDRL